MKTNVNFYEFSRWFEVNRPHNFSRVGLQALFDYFEEYEEGTGEEIEFDPIAICCDFTEYDDLDEFKANYTCDKYQEIEDWDGLEDYTLTIPLGSGMDPKNNCIIQNF
tara:strand:- start:9900 stop:10223 length:324 start_codon:yes stop_codon:yes gene_type:complete